MRRRVRATSSAASSSSAGRRSRRRWSSASTTCSARARSDTTIGSTRCAAIAARWARTSSATIARAISTSCSGALRRGDVGHRREVDARDAVELGDRLGRCRAAARGRRRRAAVAPCAARSEHLVGGEHEARWSRCRTPRGRPAAARPRATTSSTAGRRPAAARRWPWAIVRLATTRSVTPARASSVADRRAHRTGAHHQGAASDERRPPRSGPPGRVRRSRWRCRRGRSRCRGGPACRRGAPPARGR